MEKPFDGRNLHLQGKEGFWFLEILKVVDDKLPQVTINGPPVLRVYF